MSQSSKGFDRIAWVYDTLVKLVFGKSIDRAQFYFLYKIPDCAQVLILGGGTGKLLLELIKVRPNSHVCYIDASYKMLLLAREKVRSNTNIEFIQGTEKNIPQDVCFDVVITNFYLDLFSEHTLPCVANKILSVLTPKGYWLVSDFVQGKKWWQRMLLWIMYRFFRIVCGIEAKKIPSWQMHITQAEAQVVSEKLFYRKFIKSLVYQRN